MTFEVVTLVVNNPCLKTEASAPNFYERLSLRCGGVRNDNGRVFAVRRYPQYA